MRHEVTIKLTFESDTLGFDDEDVKKDFGNGMNFLKYLTKEEGISSIIDVSNEEMADAIIDLKRID